jgi:RES domain-containing protein
MLVYRITHHSYSTSLNASGLEGRWNSGGKKVIYCSQTIELAFLENMIRRQGVGFNHDFKIMTIEIPDALKINTIDPASLKPGWRTFRNYSFCQAIGDKWYATGSSAVLRVPSAVLPESSNYVINSTHKDFRKIKLINTSDLLPDERIENILKKYRS